MLQKGERAGDHTYLGNWICIQSSKATRALIQPRLSVTSVSAIAFLHVSHVVEMGAGPGSRKAWHELRSFYLSESRGYIHLDNGGTGTGSCDIMLCGEMEIIRSCFGRRSRAMSTFRFIPCDMLGEVLDVGFLGSKIGN